MFGGLVGWGWVGEAGQARAVEGASYVAERGCFLRGDATFRFVGRGARMASCATGFALPSHSVLSEGK